MSQNINKFWSGKLGLQSALDYSSYWDFQIGEDDYYLSRFKDRTDPILWFDSNYDCQQLTCGDSGITINSLVLWSGATTSGFTINDIGLTGIDTRYTNQMSGVSINFAGGETVQLKMVNGNLVFDNGYGPQPIKYNIYTDYDFSGRYYKGDGGFFQGFFKLHDYPFELLPTRMKKGWTTEFLLKVGCCDCNECSTTGLTLNDLYPNNRDIFFLIGARAENKYWDWFSGETSVTTSSGIPLYPESGNTQSQENSFVWWMERLQSNFGCGVDYVSPETSPAGNKDTSFDIINNVLAFRLDCNTHKIGYRKVAFSGVCTIDTSSSSTADTRMSAIAVIEEQMSPDPIPISGTCTGQTWAHVVVKFERQFTLDGCDLYNRGGINDINYDDYTTYLKLLKYQNESNWRKGKLVFYVNGKRHFVVDDFEEIIPRQLDTHKEKQQGVPFNISWGGGTQGLMESVTFNGWNGIEQDSSDFQLLMQRNFAGTWCGGYAMMKMYDKPLENHEIVNNFCYYLLQYNLERPNCCMCLPNNPYQV